MGFEPMMIPLGNRDLQSRAFATLPPSQFTTNFGVGFEPTNMRFAISRLTAWPPKELLDVIKVDACIILTRIELVKSYLTNSAFLYKIIHVL